jgi:MOSC domain-containing protein YiiM
VVRIGTAVLQVSAPRIPCSTFARWVEQDQWVKRFNDAGRWGTYLRVLEPGDLAAGDDIVVVEPRTHGVSVADIALVFTGDRDHERLLRVAECEDSPQETRDKAQAALAL